MTRNLKLALGCGGAGCLGLIVAIAAASVAYMFVKRQTVANQNDNINVSTNSSESGSSDRNSSDNGSANNRTSTNSDDASSSEESSSSSMADDDKHKLFQAANMTGDTETIQRVWKKLGLMKSDGGTTPAYEQFAKNHFAWAMKNLEFIQSINTPEKAKAYVDANIDD